MPTAARAAGPDAAPPESISHAVLRLVEVSRRFDSVLAVAPLTLTLEPGAVCLVEGANGSGKTTLLRLAVGLLEPSTGQRVAPVGPALYLRAGDGARGAQTVAQAVAFAARLGTGDLDEALCLAQLDALSGARVERLSSGQRARVSLAVAVAARPRLACLDEPTAHLDEGGVACAARVVERLAADGTAILVATHDPQTLAEVADARLRFHNGLLELVT